MNCFKYFVRFFLFFLIPGAIILPHTSRCLTKNSREIETFALDGRRRESTTIAENKKLANPLFESHIRVKIAGLASIASETRDRESDYY